ncbi:hypothetical protein ACER0C_001171 [Sarotherodon galilaeus]
MLINFWGICLVDQPKSTFHFPEMIPGDLGAAQFSDSIPDPELIELVHCGHKLKDDLTLDACGIQPGSTLHILKKTWLEVTASREFRVFHAALHSLSSAYRNLIDLGVLQDKDLYVQFTDPNMLDGLISSHPALVNAIILVLHSVAGSMPAQSSASSSRNVSASSYSVCLEALSTRCSDSESPFQLGDPSLGPAPPLTPVGTPILCNPPGKGGPRPIRTGAQCSSAARPHRARDRPGDFPDCNDLIDDITSSKVRGASISAAVEFGFGRQTLSLLSRLGLKLSFLLKHIVRAGSGDPESSLSYAAIDVGCREFP